MYMSVNPSQAPHSSTPVNPGYQQLTARVSGRVQGVGYRYFVRTAAKRLGIKGWVCNERDGTVCVRAEGNPVDLKQLLRALYTGPSLASVQHVNYEWSEPSGRYTDFTIRS